MAFLHPATDVSESSLIGLSDEALVALAAQGGEAAFGELYRRHRGPLYNYCLGILRHPEDAQDAVQATMTRALAALERHEAPASWRPWLFSIAHNESVDQLRSRRPHGDLHEAERVTGSPLDGRVEQRQQLAAIIEDLERLSERQRTALLLREMRGYSDREIGAALAIPVRAVRQAVFEARAALKDIASGRELPCAAVRGLIVNGDGRALRSRPVRAHLRSCSDCRGADAARRVSRRALWPLPIPLHELLTRLGGAVPSSVEAIGGSSIAVKAAVLAIAGATAGGGVAALNGAQADPWHKQVVVAAPSAQAAARTVPAAVTARGGGLPGDVVMPRASREVRGPVDRGRDGTLRPLHTEVPDAATVTQDAPATGGPHSSAGSSSPAASGRPERPSGSGGRQAAGRPEGAGRPDAVGRPDGAGPPPTAGRPPSAGRPPGTDGAGRSEGAGEPQGTGLPAGGPPAGAGHPKGPTTPGDPGPTDF